MPSLLKPREAGFRAEIKGANLWDLVQMQAQGRGERAIRVTSGHQSGLLYFRELALVHAVSGGLVGEAAAVDILRWNTGTFERSEEEWPEHETLTGNWQALMLRAAQLQDEEGLVSPEPPLSPSSGKRDTHVNRRELPPRPIPSHPPRPSSDHEAAAPLSGRLPSPSPAGGFEILGELVPEGELSDAVRLSRAGTLVEGRGEAEEMSWAVAYVTRLAELMGQSMALGKLVGLQARFENSRLIVAAEPTGDTVALRGDARSHWGAWSEGFRT